MAYGYKERVRHTLLVYMRLFAAMIIISLAIGGTCWLIFNLDKEMFPAYINALTALFYIEFYVFIVFLVWLIQNIINDVKNYRNGFFDRNNKG